MLRGKMVSRGGGSHNIQISGRGGKKMVCDWVDGGGGGKKTSSVHTEKRVNIN